MPTLSEAKKLIGAWAKDPITGRRGDSIRYHFDLHGGSDLWRYLRDARTASLRLNGPGTPIYGRTPDVIGYKVKGARLVTKMKTLTTDLLAEEISRTAQEAKVPFPAHDCETMARQAGIDPQSLVSDLDTYFYDVWSPANGARKLSRKSDAWLRDLQTDLGQDFFSRYAHYAPLKALITREDVPDLYQRLQLFDRLRKDLVLFLSELLDRHETEKNANGVALRER